jgi:hypothetical protein
LSTQIALTSQQGGSGQPSYLCGHSGISCASSRHVAGDTSVYGIAALLPNTAPSALLRRPRTLLVPGSPSDARARRFKLVAGR